MSPATPLQVLSWTGYGKIREAISDCDQCKTLLDKRYQVLRRLNFEVKEKDNAEEIYQRFSASGSHWDAVVVDHEYRDAYEDYVLEFNDDHIHSIGYVPPFNNPRYWQPNWDEIENEHHRRFVPLRFGTNGVVCSPAIAQDFKVGPPQEQFDLVAFLKSDEPLTKVAVWEWWLPNMLLLAKAAGCNPYRISDQELQTKVQDTVGKFVDRLKQARTKAIYPSLSSIIQAETESPFDFILGPGEMVAAPIFHYRFKKDGAAATPVSRIPASGGFKWLEFLVISDEIEESPGKKEAALELLGFLQEPHVQKHLTCGGWLPERRRKPDSYWAYPLNNKKGIEALDEDIRAAFRNVAFENKKWDDFKKWLASSPLEWRRLPKDHEKWRKIWQHALEDLRA